MEPQHAVTIGAEMRGSCGIFLGSAFVDATVEFYSQLAGGAVKVQDKLPDGMLRPKPQAAKFFVP